jgi:hypothetical protein
LDQRFGDNAAAHIAAGGPRDAKVARLVDVNLDVDPKAIGKLQEEIREERSGGTATDDTDA